MKVDAIVEKAFKMAIEAQNNSYSPYSHFQVGAALKIKGEDKIFSGCNVENASYGATVCAERVAITNTIAAIGKAELEFLVVVTNTNPAIGPCALCLQVLSEFASGDLPIYLANRNEIQRKVFFRDCLPNPFSEIPEQI